MKTILHDDGRPPLLQKALRSSSMSLSAFILLIVFVRGSFAQTSIMLDFNTDGVLPSAQGFTYISTGLSNFGTHGAPEASVFSVSGGFLHMNTAALGPSTGTAYYQAVGLFDPAKDLLIEFRMQLFGESTRNFGIFALASDLTFAGASFESDGIFAYPSIFPVPDPSAFHIYRIFYHASSRTYDFFIDGALIGTQQYVYVGAEPNLLQFGDLTAHFGFNGHADIDYITIQNPPAGATVDFTDRAAFAAATTNVTRVGFAGILPPGVRFGGYSQLDVPGVSFSTPVPNTFVNVTTAGYYSPNVYPADFIVDSVNQATRQPNPNNTLFIALTQPTFAVGLDIGGLGFSGMGAGTITLSNGHVFSIASLPTVGNTTFVGFISTQPITNLTFSTTNDSWVVEDLLIANPIVPSCTFSLSPSGQKFGSQGGLGTFFVNTGAGCAWTPTFNDPWLTPFPFLIPHIAFPGGGPTFGTGPGPGKVSFNVAPNLGARRSGSISVSNQTFHVDQEGGTPACTFSINPSHAVIDDLGGNLRVVVTAPGSCRWTAASNAGWLSVASGASGSGTASVSIHVASNTGGARTGTVTIAGQTFAVSQGGGACGALDVTAETSVLRGGYSLLQFTTYIYSGTITVRNISDVTLHPPLYVVLVGLPNHLGYPYGVTSFGALQTTCFTPAGDNMYLLPTGDLPPGSSTPISPLFFTQSLFGGISYQPRVLSGTPTH